MKERKITHVFRLGNPEELIVFRAASLENQIRFYINATQYFTAIDRGNGKVLVDLGEEEKKGKEKKIATITVIKEFIKLFSICLGLLSLGFVVLWYLGKIINNILVFLLIMNIIFFIINIVNVIILESIKITPSMKSKHSAEHMMVNFLEINKRLPQNIEEVKKCSRFSLECGSRKLIKGIAEDLIRNIFASIFAVIVSEIVSYFFESSVTNVIIFLATYGIVRFVAGKWIAKHNNIIKPIKRGLIYIAQCANTTKNVKDKDLVLAYYAAREWIKVVYPEFYIKENDIFLNKLIKEETL